jgi:hypothetical protein
MPWLPDHRGNDEILASLWSLDQNRRGETFQAKIDVERTGFNWGMGGGVVVIIVTGLDGSPQKLQGFTADGWDFNASIGAAWGALAKRGKDARGIKNLVKLLTTTLRKGESLSPEKWEKIWDAAKVINGIAGLDPASGKIEMTVIDVPGPWSVGAELSLFVSTTKVKTVFGNVRAFGG